MGKPKKAVVGGTFYDRKAADRAAALTRQQRGFNDLVEVQTEAKTINQQLSSLMAKDLQWSRLLQSLQAAAPSGVTITNITAALLSDAAISAKPATLASDTVGTLTLGGVGPTKTVIAAYVDALARVTGVANALPGDVNQQQQAGLQFSIHMDITKAALGGRFAKVARR